MTSFCEELSGLDDAGKVDAILQLIIDNQDKLMSDPEFQREASRAGCDCWIIESPEIEDVSFDDGIEEYECPFAFDASGEPEEDRGVMATRITGTASAVIDCNGKISFESVVCELDYDS